MGKTIKKTIYEVRKSFEKDGYIPKFTNYINNNTKLDYICPKGHEHSITWSKWQAGRRCPYCAGRSIINIDIVKVSFKKYNYICLEDAYINNSTKIKYRCPNGYEHSITWAHWSQGKRCPCCSKKSQPKLCEILQSFKDVEYKPLFTKYKNCTTKLNYICDKGHKNQTTWAVWKKGFRCPHCSGNAKKTLEELAVSFSERDYVLLDDVYVNSSTKLNYICPNGHNNSMTWRNWNKGRSCPDCPNINQKTFEDVKLFIEDESYIFLNTKYKGTKDILYTICPNNHEYTTRWDSWNLGTRCPKCTNIGISNFEKAVKQTLLDKGIDIIENDRTTIKNPNTNCMLELDILFPCKTKAIECNGVYWHSSQEVKVKDEIKQKQCKELGIYLLVITDEEWNTDSNIKNKLLKFST